MNLEDKSLHSNAMTSTTLICGSKYILYNIQAYRLYTKIQVSRLRGTRSCIVGVLVNHPWIALHILRNLNFHFGAVAMQKYGRCLVQSVNDTDLLDQELEDSDGYNNAKGGTEAS